MARPATSFYTESEATRFIEKNQGLIGIKVFTDEDKKHSGTIKSLNYSKVQTGTNIFIYSVSCALGNKHDAPLYQLISINGPEFTAAINK